MPPSCVEDAVSHMHMGSVRTFEGPPRPTPRYGDHRVLLRHG
jgi:hypothetical protein